MGRYADGRWSYERWERKGHRFAVGGRSGSSGSAINDVVCQLWNPDSTRSLWVDEIMYTRYQTTAAGNREVLVRTSARGTTSQTITPDADNDFDGTQTPDTGAVLDLADFSVEPTLSGPPLAAVAFEANLDTGFLIQWLWPDRGIRVPPGTGLAVSTPVALLLQSEVTYRFWE